MEPKEKRAMNVYGQMSIDTSTPTIYGCEALFDICSDNALMSLSFEGSSPFLDWLGWIKTNTCLVKKNFITYVRAAATAPGGTETAGWLSDPCASPNGVEWDHCDFTLQDFARLRREGPVRDITKLDLKYCELQPRYRLDGTMITDDREYDMRLITEVQLQDLKQMVIDGNASTAGQFSGLQQLIKTGYTGSDGIACELMDSIVVDWNDNGMDGGSGATWNGGAIASTVDFVELLTAIYRRIRHRIRMAPSLASQSLKVGDIIIVMPEDFIPCLLDAYTCWSVCDGDYMQLNTLEGRQFRDKLLGGMFGAGKITLEGMEIPIMPYDYGTIIHEDVFDLYMLTGQVGNVKILHGEYNDLSGVAAKRGDRFATDGGRLLTWREDDHTCEQQFQEMQPRLVCWAPWAQARVQNVKCSMVGGIISSDPWSEYFPYP